jgi:quercetin dioxygenase-like cupin family protein
MPDLAAAAKRTVSPEKKLAHATGKNSPSVPGRRSFMRYRDLGVTTATAGSMRAQVMTAIEGMNEPTGWHYHTCENQFVYCLRGWVDLEFETGEAIRLEPGDSLLLPGGLRHNELRTSDDFELLEVSTPSELGTVPCDPP